MAIETNITLKDGVSPALRSMNRALNIVLSTLQSVSKGFQRPIDVAAFNAARTELARAAVHIDNIEVGTNDAVVAQQQLANTANNVANAERSVANEIKQAVTQQQKFNADNQSIVSVVQRMDAGFQSVVTELKNITYYVSGIVPGLHKIRDGVNNIKNAQIQTAKVIRDGNRELQKTATSIYRANVNQLRLTSSFKQGVLTQLKLKNVTQEIKPAIDQNGRSQQRFNEYVRGGVNDSYRFLKNIRDALGVYLGFQSVGGVIKIADKLTSTRARIDLINKGLYTTDEVMRKIYESAMRSRGSYMEMADAVSKMAMRAPSIFNGGIDEVIAFTETLNKMAVVSGAEVQELNSAMLQITQALGAGVMRGDEFKSVIENLPVANQAVADYLKVAVDRITELAHDGKITADIFKRGILSAANDISKKMGQMKWTWAQVWEVFKNSATMAFEGVLGRLSDIANSDRFKSFTGGVGKVMVRVAEIVTDIFELITKVGAWLYDNWKKLKPIILGVVSAMIAFNFALYTTKAVLAIYNLMLGVMAAKKKLAAGATLLMTSQQVGLNMALLACPWTWVIGGIIAMIAVIGTIIACTYDWEKSNIDFKQTTINVMNAIKKVIKKTANFLKSAWLKAWDKIKQVALKAWGKIKQLALDVWAVFKAIGDFFVRNWSFIAPILWGIVGAFAAYKTALIAISVWHGICAGAIIFWKGVLAASAIAVAIWNGVITFAKFILSLFSIATWKQVAANIAMTVSGWAATSPLLFWIVVIAAIIALFYIIIACINKWCETSISATGLICGLFTALYAHIYDMISLIWNAIASLVEFFVNVWNHPMYSVKKLFVDLAINVLDMFIAMTKGCDEFATKFVNAMYEAINYVLDGWNWLVDKLGIVGEKMGLGKASKIAPIKSITSELSKTKALLESTVVNKPDGYWEAPKMEKKGYHDYAMKGYNWGANLGDNLGSSISDLWAKGKDKLSGLLNNVDLSKITNLIATKDPSKIGKTTDDLEKALRNGFDDPALDKIAKNTGKTADNTSGLAVSEEHLGYMRNLAEREAINRFTSNNTKVEMTNNNKIDSKLDMDEFVNYIISAISNPSAAKTHS